MRESEPWFVFSEEVADADAVKASLAKLVDGTPEPTKQLWCVTEGDLAVAVTGHGPKAEAHAKGITMMHGAVRLIARGPIAPPPDPGAHSWEAYAKFWQAEAAKYIGYARTANASLHQSISPQSDCMEKS